MLSFLVSLCTASTICEGQTQENRRTGKAEVEFVGNKVFPTRELAEKMKGCQKKYSVLNEEHHARVLEYCLSELRRYIASQGYLEVKLGSSQFGSGPGVKVVVDEGRRYRLGRIAIEGAELFTHEFIRGLLKLRRGEFADGEVIDRWLNEKLKREYARLGYIQFIAEVVPEFTAGPAEGSEGIVNLKIIIDEGQQFKVRRIEFVGNANTRDDIVRRALFIREGEVFNQELYEQSLQRLNELGLFEEVTDKDVDFTVDGEAALLSLRIKVKEKIKRGAPDGSNRLL
jgi:outer membrane protein insertion porin family